MSTNKYSADKPMRVGLAGFGNVGQTLARMLTEGLSQKLN